MRRQEAYASGREAGWYQWPVGRYCVARLVPQWCRPEGVCLMTLLTGLLMLAGGCSHSTAVLKQEAVPKAMAASFSPSAFLDEPPQKAKKPDEKAETPSPKGVAAANTSKKKAPYPEIPIKSSDEKTREFIRLYAYKQREATKQYLARAERLLPMAKTIAAQSGVPEDIAYLFMLESGANTQARSPANALGMWQFMPATARSYGLRVDSWVDERLDPARSTEAAMLYLKDLYGMFGCWRLALSAYNSGENKLNRVLCQEDAAEYEDICNSKRLRRETKEFFPRFQAIATIAKNPEKYGFSPLRHRTYEKGFDSIHVDHSYSLKTVAGLLCIDHQRLVELNPALHRGMTPGTGQGYALKVPGGMKQKLLTRLSNTPSEKPTGYKVHVVTKGDTVPALMRRYNVSRAMLAKLNPDVNLGSGSKGRSSRTKRAEPRLPKGVQLVVPVSGKPTGRPPRVKNRLTAIPADNNG